MPPEVLALVERSTRLRLFGAFSAVEGRSARIPGGCEYLDVSVPSSIMEFIESIAHTEGLGLRRFMRWFSFDLLTIARLTKVDPEALSCQSLPRRLEASTRDALTVVEILVSRGSRLSDALVWTRFQRIPAFDCVIALHLTAQLHCC